MEILALVIGAMIGLLLCAAAACLVFGPPLTAILLALEALTWFSKRFLRSWATISLTLAVILFLVGLAMGASWTDSMKLLLTRTLLPITFAASVFRISLLLKLEKMDVFDKVYFAGLSMVITMSLFLCIQLFFGLGARY